MGVQYFDFEFRTAIASEMMEGFYNHINPILNHFISFHQVGKIIQLLSILITVSLSLLQSVVADVASMTRERDWSPEERLHLEAEIINRTAPPLNLSPSPMVAIINNKLHQRKYKFSTVPIKRAARRFSQVRIILCSNFSSVICFLFFHALF